MLLDDLIILGRACPEPLQNGRVTVCLAGYSYEHGLIRLYPTHPRMKMKRWDIVKIEVERNQQDTRAESWKIVGSRSNWDDLDKQISPFRGFTMPHTKLQYKTSVRALSQIVC
ncbi:MAG: hypothetical protein Q9P01_06615 [Anaerolineae bacterium]|nr:hypothetical protein [Anaerolineae bacterium]MDQ7034505.1 hypothetical protein [Anaerolineae bacterium]